MNVQQTKAYDESGLPKYDPYARAAFIAGWRAACKTLKRERQNDSFKPDVQTQTNTSRGDSCHD